MKNRVVKTTLALVVASGAVFGLAACSGDAAAADSAPAAVATTEDAAVADDVVVADIDVYQDLLDVRDVVAENLEWGDQVWEQIMLADDVPSPEMKYGLLVVPFFPSDATERHTRTVSITDGNFYVDITSADTGIVWRINQAGEISQVG